MSKTIKLKRGFDINLAGKAEKKIASCPQPELFAIKPLDFVGMQRPKVVVAVGDSVKAGTPILFDKKNDRVMYVAPVSGEIVEIKTGLKRRVEEIKILADKTLEYEEFAKHDSASLSKLSQEEITEKLLKGGVWPQVIQRPYGVVANPEDKPKAIFISAFDTNPLAADYDFIFKGQEKYLQAGIDIFSKLTEGKVYLSTAADSSSSVFSNLKNVEQNSFEGKHPAGNVGVHIHHLNPINKGEIVWTINPYGLIQAGKLFLEGRFDASKLIALTGSEIKTPQYYQTYQGVNIEKLIKSNLTSENLRFISGSALTGSKIEKNGFLGYYDHTFTVIPEGDEHELFGWILPSTKKLSFHRGLGLFSWLFPNNEYKLNTNTRGEARAFVQSGVLERVVPMDIFPTHLLKAIMAQDFDNMEALGLYEIVEEDLALCEFVDVSKHKVQAIIREGLDLLQYS